MRFRVLNDVGCVCGYRFQATKMKIEMLNLSFKLLLDLFTSLETAYT